MVSSTFEFQNKPSERPKLITHTSFVHFIIIVFQQIYKNISDPPPLSIPSWNLYKFPWNLYKFQGNLSNFPEICTNFREICTNFRMAWLKFVFLIGGTSEWSHARWSLMHPKLSAALHLKCNNTWLIGCSLVRWGGLALKRPSPPLPKHKPKTITPPTTSITITTTTKTNSPYTPHHVLLTEYTI